MTETLLPFKEVAAAFVLPVYRDRMKAVTALEKQYGNRPVWAAQDQIRTNPDSPLYQQRPEPWCGAAHDEAWQADYTLAIDNFGKAVYWKHYGEFYSACDECIAAMEAELKSW